MRIFFIFFCTIAILNADPSDYHVMKFNGFYNGEKFSFIYRDLEMYNCTLKDVEILKFAPSTCLEEKERIRFNKFIKKEIQTYLMVGKNYYVRLYEKIDDSYICDIADNKINYRLLFVQKGFATTTSKNEKLQGAQRRAYLNEVGVYEKFPKTKRCVRSKFDFTVSEAKDE